jgi:hypothetical protein
VGSFPFDQNGTAMGVSACAELLQRFFQRPSLGPTFSSHNSADGFLFRD